MSPRRLLILDNLGHERYYLPSDEPRDERIFFCHIVFVIGVVVLAQITEQTSDNSGGTDFTSA